MRKTLELPEMSLPGAHLDQDAQAQKERHCQVAIHSVVVILTMFAAFLSLIFLKNLGALTVYPLMGFLAGLTLLRLARQGYLTLVAWLLPLVSFGVAACILSARVAWDQVSLWGFAEVVFLFPGLVALAGLIFGRRGVAILTLASIEVLAIIDYNQRLSLANGFSGGSLVRLVVVVVLVSLVAGLNFLVIENIHYSMERLYKHKRDLAASSQTLQVMRAALKARQPASPVERENWYE